MPLAIDDVFVLNAHTVTIDIAALAQNVTVNTGGVLRFATGTARSLTEAQVIASITYPDFQCRECNRMIDWNTTPRKVQAMRAEYLRRRAR